jgi:hypothetical protein
LRDRNGIALQCIGDRIDAEFDAVHGRRRQDKALIVRELRDVMIDDRREIVRNGDFFKLALGRPEISGFMRRWRSHRS